MGAPENRISDFVDVVRSWVSRRGEPANLSRDFWMPDNSCRVCYDCDSHFTVFNRKHHCRICGRVFCAKCTANSVPAPSSEDEEQRARDEEWERIRVCNYCFRQWEQGSASLDNGSINANLASPGISPSPSQTSLVSTQSSCTSNSGASTVGSTTPYSTGPYQRVQYNSEGDPWQASQVEQSAIEQDGLRIGGSSQHVADALCSPGSQLGYGMNSARSDEDDDYGIGGSHPHTRHFSHTYGCYGPFNFDEYAHIYGSQYHHDGEYADKKSLSCSSSAENHSTRDLDASKNSKEEASEHHHPYHGVPLPSDAVELADSEPVDFENSGLLWLPPAPEDFEDEREALLCEDNDEDDGEGSTGEWGYLRSSEKFGSEDYHVRDKTGEDLRKAMKNVVEGNFRALVSQLLQAENLPVADEDDRESWLEIVTYLSWEAASLLTPDTSKGGGMDPGGYVKVKCVACGRRSESKVVKGVVCKKNVAHRRMMSKIDKPRLLILGGALEYQRVTNLLSSVDTLLQQEMDHLKMAVAKIDAHHPNVLLVEKSVSRYAQDYLLGKNISLALNIKRPLLERIARCTGAQIAPSIDHLTSQKLGYCDIFHVERYFEDLGSAGQGGKKLTKTLMYFEGCPKPFGCTILLKGANGDELKKVKHVVQYGVFAAYHLALETSFLADEGASLPQHPLASPITVALPEKPSCFDRSISMIPGLSSPYFGRPLGFQSIDNILDPKKGTGELDKFSRHVAPHVTSSIIDHVPSMTASSTGLSSDPSAGAAYRKSTLSLEPTRSVPCMSTCQEISVPNSDLNFASGNENTEELLETYRDKKSDFPESGFYKRSDSNCFATSVLLADGMSSNHSSMSMGHNLAQDSYALKHANDNRNGELAPLKEDFPPSPSDHQSILVSLSTRCVWKGTICERAHLLRIKYYGSFDKPLGRFLLDHLFDQNYRCHSCEMPPEAHVHCYTHRQGSLTISVKKFSEFLLPGERDGKIWMWHRCLRCPRTNGFPPATCRIVMSDAAWGLSFGKFLELSFSNHTAASRVASCGHSLHRDCLRFYGFGRMVACFRYAPISVHSVYFPPSKVEFYYDNQDWIQKEADEVCHWAELLFSEVQSALQRIPEKIYSSSLKDHDPNTSEAIRLCISELKAVLQREREEFQESISKVTSRDLKTGLQAIDIFEINKLRRRILCHSFIWDQRLVYASALSKKNEEEGQRVSVPKTKEKRVSSLEKLVHIDQTFGVDKARDMDLDKNLQETDWPFSSNDNMHEKTGPLVSAKVVRRVHSEGEFRSVETLSENLDALGKSNPLFKENSCSDKDSTPVNAVVGNVDVERSATDKESATVASAATTRRPIAMDNIKSGLGMSSPYSFALFKSPPMTSLKIDINEYNPVYISLSRELERKCGARLLLPAGINDTIVPVYDDEPTSIIAYALMSSDYHTQMSDTKKPGDSSASLLVDSTNLISVNSFDDSASDVYRSFGSTDESILSLFGSRGSLILDPLLYTNDLHARVCFSDDGCLGKVKYTVTCYYAKRFEALRRTCCPSELDFIRSLSRCKKWGAQGGKSNVFFAKTLDDRFIIKQVTKTELESFIKFGPAYFKYLSESISTGSSTCLAKILGIYQVVSKHVKGGKESKMDVLVMENLLFRRSITRLYDLKGSSRSRYNPDTSGSNKVLLDQNLIEAMPTSPIFVGSKAKRLLERAVWNDTAFLASIDVMDYSLLVGMDEEKHELVLGIIDFMRQYTWDKHLETWVKAAGILGGSKNATPTVISPQQYKKRFRKAMTTYFLMVPDQWSPTTIIRNGSHSENGEESLQHGTSIV